MDKKSRDLVMGKLYLKNKDYKMAEKSFSEYLNSNPEDFQALKMLAQVQEHLNDTAKAFDLYQRCYLSQPDRKGVLLDICRLLLVNDPRLDHVDQEKWLKLAVQAFPTNPIVTSLRGSLPNSQDSHPGRITTKDMIMEKLTFLEDRFKNFEDRFETFEDRFKNFEDGFKTLEDGFKTLGDKMQGFHDLFKKIEQRFDNFESKFKNFGDKLQASEDLSKKIESRVDNFEHKFKNLGDKVQGSDGLFKKIENRVDNFEGKFKNLELADEKKPFQTPSLPFFTGLTPQTSFNLPQTSFNQSSEKTDPFKLDGVNLFTQGLKNNNLPMVGSWTMAAPKKDEPKNEPKEENNEDDAEDDDGGFVKTEELPIENNCDLRPIEIKSGEEDEDIVFKHRCKLFRFRDKEYKERGLGDIKVLKHKEKGKGRLIMRRDMINLVCLNCWSCQNIERVRDTQVRFAGLDASDGDAEMTVFLAKFKTQEMTDEFMKHLKDLFTEN